MDLNIDEHNNYIYVGGIVKEEQLKSELSLQTWAPSFYIDQANIIKYGIIKWLNYKYHCIFKNGGNK